MPQGAKAVTARAARRRAAHARQRLQADRWSNARSPRCWSMPGGRHEIRQARHHQPDRPAQGRRQTDRPHRWSAENNRHRALCLRAPRRRAQRRPTATWSAPASPRAGSRCSTTGRAQGARRARGRDRGAMPASSARAGSTPRSCLAARRSSTTTRPSRWWSPKPSSRRAPRRRLIRVDVCPREGRATIWRRRRPRRIAAQEREARQCGRRLRRRVRGGPGAVRRDLYDAGRIARDDGTACLHRGVGRRQAHACGRRTR